MNEPKKRDFVSQIITLLEQEKNTMSEKGFDPNSKIQSLTVLKDEADRAEIAQQDAAAKAKEATTLSQNTLEKAYKSASDIADLISGLYGKDSELVKKIRKFRK